MIVAVVFSVLFAAVIADGGCGGGAGPRVGELRLAAKLADRVDALEDRADTATEKVKGYVRQGQVINSRLSRIEDDECDSHRQFQCGGFERRCLSDLLVCDGTNDCESGSDEDEKLCHSPVHIGSVFEGHVPRRSQGGCGADVTDLRFAIIFEEHLSWFQSRIKVKAAVTLTHKDGSTSSAVVRGYYNFSLRTVVLLPFDDVAVKLGITCHFDGVQDDRCLVKIRSSNLDACNTFGAHRID